MACKALGLFTLEGRLELVNVQGIKEKQGGGKVVVFSWQGTYEGHAEKLIVKSLKTEVGGAQCFDVLQCLVSTGHHSRQGLILFFANVEEIVVGIETSPWFLLEVYTLQLLPHLHGVRFDLFDMGFLVVLKCQPYLPTCLCSLSLPFTQLLLFISSRSVWVNRSRRRCGTINILPELFGAQIGFHVVSPLAPIGGIESREGAFGFRRHFVQQQV